MKELEECLEALLAEVKPIEKQNMWHLRMPVTGSSVRILWRR